jgi:Fe-S-cluster containining protein
MTELSALHDEVDRAAAAVAVKQTGKLACARGCSGCCMDGLTVFEVEAERIRTGAAALLSLAAPHPPGRCAFPGSEGECRIYAVRPYVCRTQGLPLRWIEDDIDYRDICELNEVAVETLEPEDCWTLGEYEERLARLQGDGRRVALRDLWANSPLSPASGGEGTE